jgi:hypothetical protein
MFLCSPAGRVVNGTLINVDAAENQVNWPSPVLNDMLDEVNGLFLTRPTSGVSGCGGSS